MTIRRNWEGIRTLCVQRRAVSPRGSNIRENRSGNVFSERLTFLKSAFADCICNFVNTTFALISFVAEKEMLISRCLVFERIQRAVMFYISNLSLAQILISCAFAHLNLRKPRAGSVGKCLHACARRSRWIAWASLDSL